MHRRAVLLPVVIVLIVLLGACATVSTGPTVLPTRFEAALPEATPSPTAIEATPTAEPVPTTTPLGFVTFWFDDGLQSTYDVVYPALRKRGWPAVVAVVADREIASRKFVPDGDPVMRWEEVHELANAGWEISSHSVTHARLNSIGDENALREEIEGSKQRLEARGFDVFSFTSPYGEEGGSAGQQIARQNYLYWRSMSTGINPVPPPRHLKGLFCIWDLSRGTVRDWIVETERTGGWLIICFHAILEEPTNRWQSTPDEFAMVLRAVGASSLEVVLPLDMFARFGYAEGEIPVLGTPTPVQPHFVLEDFEDDVRLLIEAMSVNSRLGVARPITSSDRLDYTGLDDYPLWISELSDEIGRPGISLIIGHRQWGPKPKVFARLNRLKSGDEVIVTGADQTLVYRVFASEVVGSNEIWSIIHNLREGFEVGGRSVLVLYTCTPYGTDWRRLLVYAELGRVEGGR